ncbi:MAG TPA: hypothetical protein VNG13_00700 [Mycobacteriales bacterium]|nr:hypothetical protein [Mycobacteriales bacterium]
MIVTIVGDFADPLSFLASQRADQIASLGLHEVRWLAVQADRSRPIGGRLLDQATADEAGRLAVPSERVPAAGWRVPNSGAATSAYAESISDGAADAMRRALFDALWVDGRRVDDPEVMRAIAFAVLNPDPPADAIRARIQANQPIVPLGNPDPRAVSRRLGYLVTLARGPLTTAGQHRIDAWRHLWQEHGAPSLPLLLTKGGDTLSGEPALDWLAGLLPNRPRTASSPDASMVPSGPQPEPAVA